MFQIVLIGDCVELFSFSDWFTPSSARDYMSPSTNNKSMEKNLLAVAVTIAFSLVGVLGDYFLKLASANENPLKAASFYIGFVLYASTAFGWVFVMKHLKLATIAVVYSVSMVLLLTAIGVVFFRES